MINPILWEDFKDFSVKNGNYSVIFVKLLIKEYHINVVIMGVIQVSTLSVQEELDMKWQQLK
jgi:hypothetical protein